MFFLLLMSNFLIGNFPIPALKPRVHSVWWPGHLDQSPKGYSEKSLVKYIVTAILRRSRNPILLRQGWIRRLSKLTKLRFFSLLLPVIQTDHCTFLLPEVTTGPIQGVQISWPQLVLLPLHNSPWGLTERIRNFISNETKIGPAFSTSSKLWVYPAQSWTNTSVG